jgi:hypothetical protein
MKTLGNFRPGLPNDFLKKIAQNVAQSILGEN